MTDSDLTDLLEKAAGKTAVGPAPISEMLNASHQRRRAMWVAAGVSVVVALTGLGIAVTRDSKDLSSDRTPTTMPAPTPPSEVQGHWRLTSATIDGQDIPSIQDDSFATFWVDASMQGQANTGCQVGTIRVERNATRFRVHVVDVGSMLSCRPDTEDPTGGQYLEALKNVDTAEVTETSLHLSGPATALTFERLDRFGEPATPQPFKELTPELSGTWVVTALTTPSGQTALPEGYNNEAFVTFKDGEITGTTGCNDFSSPYTHSGGDDRDLHFDQVVTTDAGCSGEPPLQERLTDVRHVSMLDQSGKRYLQLHQDNWMIVAVLRPPDEVK